MKQEVASFLDYVAHSPTVFQATQQACDMLDAAGYDCGKIDDIAGVKTIAAIRAYQQEHGLTVDGLAGKRTVAALAGE